MFGTSLRNRKSDRQEEMTYILYMFLGSCFKKCECRSSLLEDHLLVCYREMNQKQQILAEERVIRAIDRFLEEEGLDLSVLNCQAVIARSGRDYRIFFRTWLENVLVTVREDGRFTLELVNEEAGRGCSA